MAQNKSEEKTITIISFDRGEKIELAGGSFSSLLITDQTAGKNKNMMGYSVFKAGVNTKQKIHIEAEELVYVVSGSGKICVGDKSHDFKAGDSLYIPSGVPHAVKNDGKEDVVMVFFFSSPNYPKTEDA
jgi:quercetin dioxygenase-like cupin family protein